MQAADEEIASILNSQLSSDEKSMLLFAYSSDDILPGKEINKISTSSVVDLDDKIQDKEANTKEDNDAISEWKDESPSLSLSQQSKAKEAHDPTIIEVLESDLTCEEKSSVLLAILSDKDISPSNDNTATTSQEVKLQGNNQDSEEDTKAGHDNLLSDETSEMIDESLSFHSPQQGAKVNVVLDESERTLKEKSAYSGTEKDIPPPEDDTSSTSSKMELQEIDQLTDAKASSQVAPSESCRILLENQVFTVKESDNNSDGNEDESTIHKQEAACKHCYRLISPESRVLKAKCGCTSSLIHEECANAWSREKGNACWHCEQEIQNTKVTLFLISPPTSIGENPKTPSKWSWWCFS